MDAFTYLKPDSIEGAVQLLAEYPEARLLSGGMSLLPSMKQGLSRPSHLIDVASFPSMKGVSMVGDRLEVGGAITHGTLGRAELVHRHIPALSHLASRIADPQVRNRGTLAGSVAGNDPAADHTAAVLGLGADLITNCRTLSADEFFIGLFTTALMRAEILIRISYPVPLDAHYEKFRHPSSGYAMAGVFVARFPDNVRVAVTGVGPCIFRWREAEFYLGNHFSACGLDNVTLSDYEINQDMHASCAYRASLAKVMLVRAVNHMTARAHGRKES